MAGKTHVEQLASLEEKRGRVDARIKELEAQIAARRRKADTRRKIVLGGGVLARATAGPGASRDVVRDAVRHMSRRDRDAFEEVGLDWLADVLAETKVADEHAPKAQHAAATSTEGDEHGK